MMRDAEVYMRYRIRTASLAAVRLKHLSSMLDALSGVEMRS